MNTLIKIGTDLWFESSYLGGTLHFRTEGADESENLLFQVGISHASLQECYHRMALPKIQWKIRDCSFTMFGDQEELRLHFCSIDGTTQRADHVLRGREILLFRYAIHALASHTTSLLN